MKVFAFCLMVIALVASATFLVYTEHYGWAWIPFLLAGGASFKTEGK